MSMCLFPSAKYIHLMIVFVGISDIVLCGVYSQPMLVHVCGSDGRIMAAKYSYAGDMP